MTTTSQVQTFVNALNAATANALGTANVYSLSTSSARRAFLTFQRDWINQNADSMIPGWREGAADTALTAIRAASMSNWNFIVSYFNASLSRLPFSESQTRDIGKLVTDIGGKQKFVVANIHDNVRAWWYQRPNPYLLLMGGIKPSTIPPRVVFDIRSQDEYARDRDNAIQGKGYSMAERFAWDAVNAGNIDALTVAVAMSWLEQGIDPNVTQPPLYAIDASVSAPGEQLRRNLSNFVAYCVSVNSQADALAAGKVITPVTPNYAGQYSSSNFWVTNSGLILGAFEIVLLFYVAPALGASNPWESIKSAITHPIEAAKAIITDPIGAAQDYAHERLKAEVIKVTGPLGRVYDIVVDPAGFVKDKFREEVLYPLQNPGEWIVDQGKKQIQNRLTGEVRDLLTGLLVTPANTVPVVITTDSVPLSTVIEPTPTGAPAKKSGSVLGPLLAVLAVVEIFS